VAFVRAVDGRTAGDKITHQLASVPRLYPEISRAQTAGESQISYLFYCVSGGRTRDRTLDLSRVKGTLSLVSPSARPKNRRRTAAYAAYDFVVRYAIRSVISLSGTKLGPLSWLTSQGGAKLTSAGEGWLRATSAAAHWSVSRQTPYAPSSPSASDARSDESIGIGDSCLSMIFRWLVLLKSYNFFAKFSSPIPAL